jgi:hypothetical protein
VSSFLEVRKPDAGASAGGDTRGMREELKAHAKQVYEAIKAHGLSRREALNLRNKLQEG